MKMLGHRLLGSTSNTQCLAPSVKRWHSPRAEPKPEPRARFSFLAPHRPKAGSPPRKECCVLPSREGQVGRKAVDWLSTWGSSSQISRCNSTQQNLLNAKCALGSTHTQVSPKPLKKCGPGPLCELLLSIRLTGQFTEFSSRAMIREKGDE